MKYSDGVALKDFGKRLSDQQPVGLLIRGPLATQFAQEQVSENTSALDGTRYQARNKADRAAVL